MHVGVDEQGYLVCAGSAVLHQGRWDQEERPVAYAASATHVLISVFCIDEALSYTAVLDLVRNTKTKRRGVIAESFLFTAADRVVVYVRAGAIYVWDLRSHSPECCEACLLNNNIPSPLALHLLPNQMILLLSKTSQRTDAQAVLFCDDSLQARWVVDVKYPASVTESRLVHADRSETDLARQRVSARTLAAIPWQTIFAFIEPQQAVSCRCLAKAFFTMRFAYRSLTLSRPFAAGILELIVPKLLQTLEASACFLDCFASQHRFDVASVTSLSVINVERCIVALPSAIRVLTLQGPDPSCLLRSFECLGNVEHLTLQLSPYYRVRDTMLSWPDAVGSLRLETLTLNLEMSSVIFQREKLLEVIFQRLPRLKAFSFHLDRPTALAFDVLSAFPGRLIARLTNVHPKVFLHFLSVPCKEVVLAGLLLMMDGGNDCLGKDAPPMLPAITELHDENTPMTKTLEDLIPAMSHLTTLRMFCRNPMLDFQLPALRNLCLTSTRFPWCLRTHYVTTLELTARHASFNTTRLLRDLPLVALIVHFLDSCISEGVRDHKTLATCEWRRQDQDKSNSAEFADLCQALLTCQQFQYLQHTFGCIHTTFPRQRLQHTRNLAQLIFET